MGSGEGRPAGDWGSENSATFIDLGRYFVPERELQLAMFCDLVPAGGGPFEVAELCCGEGLLAEALLERFPQATVRGLDGSPEMLARAAGRLARFGERFRPQRFDLADRGWRLALPPARAVVSSLAIHHLDDAGKAELFRDVLAALEPGGALVIADVVRASDERAARLAADAWDEAVRRRGAQLDGDPARALALFERERWNMYRYPEPEDDPATIDRPSLLADQLRWLREAGFAAVDVYWMLAGHAMFGGVRPS